MSYMGAGRIYFEMKRRQEHEAFLDLPPTTILIPTDEKLFAFRAINPSCFCHNLVIPVERIATVKDLRMKPEDYFLVSHMLSENVNSVQYRSGFNQHLFNDMYRPSVPRCRKHVYPRKESIVTIKNDKLFAFRDINPSCFCHNLAISMERIATLKDLRRTPEDYFLVSHKISRDAVNSIQYRFGFTQPPFNNMYHPYVPRCRKLVFVGT